MMCERSLAYLAYYPLRSEIVYCLHTMGSRLCPLIWPLGNGSLSPGLRYFLYMSVSCQQGKFVTVSGQASEPAMIYEQVELDYFEL